MGDGHSFDIVCPTFDLLCALYWCVSILELDVIRRDITSLIWLTYRKGFIPIGDDDGLTSDKGWGCTLRCGQMVLAQALVRIHMNRDWIWTPDTRWVIRFFLSMIDLIYVEEYFYLSNFLQLYFDRLSFAKFVFFCHPYFMFILLSEYILSYYQSIPLSIIFLCSQSIFYIYVVNFNLTFKNLYFITIDYLSWIQLW